MNLRIAAFPASFLLVLLACSSSSTTPKSQDFAGSCDLLASRCHDVSTALGAECHDLGHAGDDAKCGPRRSECLAECPEGAGKDASAPVDAGSDVHHDGGSDVDSAAPPGPCEAYCACMTATCASEPGYPFADEAACLAACAGFSADDRACYTDHCEDAKTAADKKHDCDHAAGTTACH